MESKICFVSDAPALSENAHGNHGIAKIFIKVLGEHISLVCTRRFRRYLDTDSIRTACGNRPLHLYPDVSALGMRKYFPSIASIFDQILFGCYMPFFYLILRRYRIKRIFILCGADGWFLFTIRMIQKMGIPVEIYLVDDMESFAKTGKANINPKLVKLMLAKVLNNCSKVYAISKGFAEYLSSAYDVPVEWLPMPSTEPPPSGKAKSPEDINNNIVFIGALNHLYVDPLRDLYSEICEINKTRGEFSWIYLEIIGYGDPEPFLLSLPNREYVINYIRLSDEERARHLSMAMACFLPYSFNPEEKQMVSTSFSCKILEYYSSGRPIIVYGPEYASIPRFFREEELALCATSKAELKRVLNELDYCKANEFLEKYGEIFRKYHSAEAIYKIIKIG